MTTPDLAVALHKLAATMDKMDKMLDRHDRVAATTRYLERRYEIEEKVRPLVYAVAKRCRVPIAALGLVTDSENVIVSLYADDGCPPLNSAYPQRKSFCSYVAGTGKPFQVDDALHDNRVLRVLDAYDGAPIALAYYGSPVFDSETGLPVGSFCIADTVARRWRNSEIRLVDACADQVTEMFKEMM